MFAFTLRSIRIAVGYAEKEVGDQCGITKQELRDIEDDCSATDLCLLDKIIEFYKVPVELVFLGPEKDCIMRNRNLQVSRKCHAFK